MYIKWKSRVFQKTKYKGEVLIYLSGHVGI